MALCKYSDHVTNWHVLTGLQGPGTMPQFGTNETSSFERAAISVVVQFWGVPNLLFMQRSSVLVLQYLILVSARLLSFVTRR